MLGTAFANERRMANPIRSEFHGDDVVALREQYALSQVEFARLIGISTATLRNWETSRRSPMGPARALLRILSADPEKVMSVLQKDAEGTELPSCAPRSS